MSSSESVSTDSEVSRQPSGMRAFIVISLLLHIPLFIYPVLRLADWLDLGWLATTLIFIPVVTSQTISRALLRDAKHPMKRFLRHVADLLLGVSPILLMTLLVAEVLVLFSLLVPQTAALFTLAVSIAFAVIGMWLAMVPKVKTVSLTSRYLSGPLKFVQITDVHIGSRNKAFLEKVVDQVNRLEPAFLCITGDFVDATGVTVETLSPLRAVNCPIYFSIGNHERYEDLKAILQRLSSLGVQVLRTATADARDDVQIVGIDDRDDAMQVQREIAKVNVANDRFTILMYHRPLGLTSASAAGVDLMISGHTHNGQIFPFNLVVNRVFQRVVGLYKEGETHLYVSQGTGTWGPVMRVGTRSEITQFEVEGV